MEYLTSVIIAALVLAAGISSLKESVEKILHPEAASYTVVSLVIIAVAVLAKFFTGRHVKKVGQELNAQTLAASGSDAFFDAILSLTTLVAAGISMIWGLSLEGWLGVVISVIIIKSGIEILLETLNSIIGERPESELTEALKETVCSFPGVHGAYDLTLHNYGPTRIIGSVHIEVDDGVTARELHKLTRAISAKVYMDYGIVLTVGIYAAGDSSETISALRGEVEALVAARPEILQMHGFFAEEDTRCAMFDLIVDFKADAAAVQKELLGELTQRHPDWRFDIVLDSDYSE